MPRPAAKAKASAEKRLTKQSKKLPKVEQLTYEQQIEQFIEYYIRFNHIQDAAVSVGVAPGDAREWGYRTLSIPSIQLRLARRREALMSETDWEVKDSMRELISVAMVDPIQTTMEVTRALNVKSVGSVDFEPGALALEQIPQEVRRCIKRLKQGVCGTGENQRIFVEQIDFYDRLHAIDMLNKHKGFYEADNGQKADAVALLLASLQSQNEGGGLAVTK